MLTPFHLLLITAVLCIVMLLVLGSLVRSGTPGIKEWTIANAIAFVSLVLFALRGVAPDFLSIEVANGLLAGAISMVYVGFRRFFSLDVPARRLVAGLALTMAGVAGFHYIVDSISARIIVVSIFHGVISFCIGLTVFGADASQRKRYPFLFAAGLAFLFSLGHFIRGAVYATGSDVLTSALHASSWNLLFLSIGALVLPIYSMGAVMLVHDRMMSKALDDANRDFLTGVWSRRAFFDIAERELSRMHRTKRPLSLLVFDVDHFKNLNDTLGHAAGDQALISIARSACREIRAMDYIARIGGEEFAILLPEVDEAAAVMVAERVRQVLNEQAYPELTQLGATAPVSVSVSIGVATARHQESMSELLNRADKALYQAKASGRNAVSLAAA